VSWEGDIPGDRVMPCGCLLRCAIIEGERTLKLFPCRITCRNIQTLLQAAEERGIDVACREAP